MSVLQLCVCSRDAVLAEDIVIFYDSKDLDSGQ
jgi:hypothetical protein